ncbi:DUF3732 domain-containing protein [Serratia marcescens]|uniref:DUF3732 domain-containing protein n=1 Tax=Serratia marcescens TaxID=615 RepID=UPI00141C58BD|nr:DUF3732 domain-containing protein [Serratia marcescens]CAB1211992.1 hypothetical protein FB6_0941 [Serratia marcescens]
MKAIIESINIFNEAGEHRFIELTNGLNVITGDSKTGKSALLEIVYYCLFSKTSSIPKGVITTFSYFYAVVFKLRDSYIIVGRHAPKTNLGSKAFIKLETNKENISPLSLSYFEDQSPTTLKAAQSKFETYLGLSVLDMKDEVNSFHHGKASIRNAVSLLFQHQNLIANKHALFYRFHDFVKRDRTIKELPIFLGWVEGNYYRLIREREDILKKVRTQEKIEMHAKNSQEENNKIIKNLVEEYLSAIDYKIDDNISYSKLLTLAKNLPPVPDIPHGSPQTEKNYQYENNLLSELSSKLIEINRKIAILENCSDISIHHAIDLKKIKSTFDIFEPGEIITCPLCASEQPQITHELKELVTHQEQLITDLNKLQYFQEDTSQELERLIKQKDSIKKDIRVSNAKIKNYEKNKIELSKLNNFREKASFMRGKVSSLISSFFKNNDIINSSDSLKDLRDKLKKIELELSQYNLDKKYSSSEARISKIMTQICNELDFEEELKPAELHFSLRDFNFYHAHAGEKISLHEMGSGANWLACHLSLFLGILFLLTIEEKSCIPAFLFLDQPSQVYFPSDADRKSAKDSDIKQVENIFNTINSVLEHIKNKSNFMPQVIILEHADKLQLKDIDFESIVRKRWRENGEKLI